MKLRTKTRNGELPNWAIAHLAKELGEMKLVDAEDGEKSTLTELLSSIIFTCDALGSEIYVEIETGANTVSVNINDSLLLQSENVLNRRAKEFDFGSLHMLNQAIEYNEHSTGTYKIYISGRRTSLIRDGLRELNHFLVNTREPVSDMTANYAVTGANVLSLEIYNKKTGSITAWARRLE